MKFAEKYAPRVPEELLLPQIPGVKKFVETLFTTADIPDSVILLHGMGGSGKSTLANLLAKQEDKWLTVVLDTAGENKESLAHLQETVYHHNHGRRLLIIGNEIDQSSTVFLNGLRDLIDKNDKRENLEDKFLMILTTNHYDTLCNKAPQVFNGERCMEILWDAISPEEMEKKIHEVLRAEGKDTFENKVLVPAIVKKFKPSIRRCLIEIERKLYEQS